MVLFKSWNDGSGSMLRSAEQSNSRDANAGRDAPPGVRPSPRATMDRPPGSGGGEEETGLKLGEKAAEQSYCTGRHRRIYRPRLAQGQCLREHQQLVEGAPVSSMPSCGPGSCRPAYSASQDCSDGRSVVTKSGTSEGEQRPPQNQASGGRRSPLDESRPISLSW